jgi:hypothetical protein
MLRGEFLVLKGEFLEIEKNNCELPLKMIEKLKSK